MPSSDESHCSFQANFIFLAGLSLADIILSWWWCLLLMLLLTDDCDEFELTLFDVPFGCPWEESIRFCTCDGIGKVCRVKRDERVRTNVLWVLVKRFLFSWYVWYWVLPLKNSVKFHKNTVKKALWTHLYRNLEPSERKKKNFLVCGFGVSKRKNVC